MLAILNELQRLEIAKDIAYQQVLLAERLSCKYKNMVRLLKLDWKLVVMAKKTMTDLVDYLQPVVMALKKNPSNQSSMLAAINQY